MTGAPGHRAPSQPPTTVTGTSRTARSAVTSRKGVLRQPTQGLCIPYRCLSEQWPPSKDSCCRAALVIFRKGQPAWLASRVHPPPPLRLHKTVLWAALLHCQEMFLKRPGVELVLLLLDLSRLMPWFCYHGRPLAARPSGCLGSNWATAQPVALSMSRWNEGSTI